MKLKDKIRQMELKTQSVAFLTLASSASAQPARPCRADGGNSRISFKAFVS